MYSLRRFRSSVGAPHTAAPDGPKVGVPVAVFPVDAARVGIVCVFHTTLPSRTRMATMLPLNVQHGYSGLSDRDSSHEATATYAMPSCTTGGALKRTASWSSGRFLHTSCPFDASSAYNHPVRSPNRSTCLPSPGAA